MCRGFEVLVALVGGGELLPALSPSHADVWRRHHLDGVVGYATHE